MEAARHSQYMQANIDTSYRNYDTKTTTKSSNTKVTWAPTLPPLPTTNAYKEDGK